MTYFISTKFKIFLLRNIIASVLLVCYVDNLYAQGPPEQLIKILVSPNHEDWTYNIGEDVKFDITVLENNEPLKGARIYYEIGPEKMKPFKTDSLELKAGKIKVDGETLKQPGFLRCIVTIKLNNHIYKGVATAAFEPLKIQPYALLPDDFLSFWDNAKKELAQLPMDARLVLLPECCTDKLNVYEVNLQGYRNSRLYGILCVPKKEGKYPALLRVPGAGVRAYRGEITLAEKEIITLEIGIHGISVNMDPQVYANLANGALNGYPFFNLDDRDRFYYKRVYLNCIRANDFLSSLPQYDGINLGVIGGSQGGALSIVTAALDIRVKYLSVMYPALCDLTAALSGRAGGWPGYFDGSGISINNKPDKLNTLGYYDVVNFAKQLKIPGIYSWGFNDDTCPPSSTYAAFNMITAPKSLLIFPETGHWNFPEQNEKMNNWMAEKLKAK
jgi:cephalosporin-C deacetylase